MQKPYVLELQPLALPSKSVSCQYSEAEKQFTYIKRGVAYCRIAPLGTFFLSTCWTLSFVNIPHIYEVAEYHIKVLIYACLIQDLVVLPVAYTLLVRVNYLHFLELLCQPAVMAFTTVSR